MTKRKTVKIKDLDSIAFEAPGPVRIILEPIKESRKMTPKNVLTGTSTKASKKSKVVEVKSTKKEENFDGTRFFSLSEVGSVFGVQNDAVKRWCETRFVKGAIKKDDKWRIPYKDVAILASRAGINLPEVLS